jgi:phosphoribosyl 1,2-cyclic phosphodiesterase
MTHGTARALAADASDATIIDSHAGFAIGDLAVQPFPVPHDAREPVQLVVTDGAARLGVLTDVGAPTRHIAAMLSGCAALVLECNYDPDMLAGGPYPQWLKARIGGPLGHLANAAAAEILAAIDRSRLQHVIAAHLSQTNNLPRLATAALSGALGCTPDEIAVADQANGFGWRSL